MTTENDRIAPKDAIWVCGACGKTSKDRYGGKTASRGWDESCMLNAVLCCNDDSLIRSPSGRVTEAEAFKSNPISE